MAKGYTKIENWILDCLYAADLEHSELVVLIFLIRFTYGFNRNTVKASIGFISHGTGLCENSVRKALKNLKNKKVVEVLYEHSGSNAQTLKLILQRNEFLCTHSMRGNTTKECSINTTKECTQEIKEEIKDKKEKKRKASPSLFPNFSIDDYSGAEAKAWKDVMSEEDFQKWLGGYVWD